MEKSRRIACAVLDSPLTKTQERKRRRRKYPNVFFKKEITLLFESIDNPKTMIAAFLTFFCAFRIAEVCKLQWVDVNLEECRVKVVDGKNHKDGFIPLSPLAVPFITDLDAWLSVKVYPSHPQYGSTTFNQSNWKGRLKKH